MGKTVRLRRYETIEQMLKVRRVACELAVAQMDGVDDARRLNAYCIFFESYLASGPRWTENQMHLLDPISSEANHRPVVRLITRDD